MDIFILNGSDSCTKGVTITGLFFYPGIFTEPEHLIGHPYPDVLAFTDEELGIPQD